MGHSQGSDSLTLRGMVALARLHYRFTPLLHQSPALLHMLLEVRGSNRCLILGVISPFENQITKKFYLFSPGVRVPDKLRIISLCHHLSQGGSSREAKEAWGQSRLDLTAYNLMQSVVYQEIGEPH